MSPVDVVWKLLGTIVGVFLDLLTLLQLTLRTPQAVAAENLNFARMYRSDRFMRTQLGRKAEQWKRVEFPLVRSTNLGTGRRIGGRTGCSFPTSISGFP